jgi:hypothetical protein
VQASSAFRKGYQRVGNRQVWAQLSMNHLGSLDLRLVSHTDGSSQTCEGFMTPGFLRDISDQSNGLS